MSRIDEEVERVRQQVAEVLLVLGRAGDYSRESLARSIAKELDAVARPHPGGVTIQLRSEIQVINIQGTLSNEDFKAMTAIKHYAERDAKALDDAGGYYVRHVSAMTSEKLHSKSDIAAELGHRDMLIDQLRRQLEIAEQNAAEQRDMKARAREQRDAMATHCRELKKALLKQCAVVMSHTIPLPDKTNDAWSEANDAKKLCEAPAADCYAELVHRVGKAAHIDGYAKCWHSVYGTPAPEHTSESLAEQYADGLAKNVNGI